MNVKEIPSQSEIQIENYKKVEDKLDEDDKTKTYSNSVSEQCSDPKYSKNTLSSKNADEDLSIEKSEQE